MLRRINRERREFVYKKSRQEAQRTKERKIASVKESMTQNKSIPTTLAREAVDLHGKLKYQIVGNHTDIDDEYKNAGMFDPKIMITTSHDPSARLKTFVKELRLLFPNAQKMNRGKYEMTTLVDACRRNDVTDFILVHETRGVPDTLIVCHLPFGPTAFFTISDVVTRHEIADIGPMSEQKPHLVFDNFTTPLGLRTMSILQHLFPVPKADSKRVMTFSNIDDHIYFRHHVYQYVNKELKLSEAGPRFVLRLYKIMNGTVENTKAADTEWVYRPYMNTTAKRLFLSDKPGLNQSRDA